jgi:hypothetical protein
MRLNTNTANRNVLHHAANANCAVLCGHSADRIVTAAKRLLGRKRQSDPASYAPVPSSSGGMLMPGCGGQGRLITSDQRPGVQTFPDSGMRPSMAGDTPAPVWATLVITRALSS